MVAEISANHKQDFGKAADLVHAAKVAGADAVKVQMYTPDLGDDSILQSGPWAGQSLRQVYEKGCMPYEWVPKLKDLADKLEIKFFTSVYDLSTVDMAESFGLDAYKIASFEATYWRLIEKLAQTNKPVFVSAGVATYKQLCRVKGVLGDKLALLKCTSNYPAQPEELNLRTILDMKRNFGITGFSDHTTGIVASVVAVSLGARVIEKHLTLDNDTLDASFSIMPERFAVMVQAIRAAENSLGKVVYGGKSEIKRINGKRTVSETQGMAD